MAGCSSCPDMIQTVLVNDVTITIERVRYIKRLVSVLNRVITESNQEIVDEINRLIGLIPHPPVIDLQYLVDLLTCPLTPQAVIVEVADNIFARMATKTSFPAFNPASFAVEAANESVILATLDPRQLLRKIAKMIEAVIIGIWRLIDEATVSFSNVAGVSYVDSETNTPVRSSDLIQGTKKTYDAEKKFQFSPEACIVFRALRRIMQELAFAMRRPDILLMQLAVTTGSVALVRETCPEFYYGTVFEQYTDEMSEFESDGLMPPGVSELAAPYTESFLMLMSRIAEWEAAALIVAL